MTILEQDRPTQGADVVWIGWMCVATRELFAGIVKNGAREKVVAGKLATAAPS